MIKQLDFEDYLKIQKEEEDELIVKNQNLIYKVLQDMGAYYRHMDLFDVGLVGLVKAAKTYNPYKNVAFSTYAYKIISNSIKQELVYESKDLLTSHEAQRISLDNLNNNDISTNATPKDYVEKNIVVNEQLQELDFYLNTYFSAKQRILFKKYYGLGYSKHSLEELAIEYNYNSVESLKFVLHMIRKRLKELIN